MNQKLKRVADAIASIPAHEPDAILKMAAAAIEAYGDSWQPIETAPKDGTDVLLFTDTRASDTVSMRIYLHTGGEHFTAVQIGFWEDAIDAPMRKERPGWRTDKIGEPTHWMPLPDYPLPDPAQAVGEG